MIRLFKHYVPRAVLLLGMLDFLLLLVAGELGWRLRIGQIGSLVEPIEGRIVQLIIFAVAVECALIAVGSYSVESLQSLRHGAARMLVAMSLSMIFVSIIFFLFPEVALWRSITAYAIGFAFLLLFSERLFFGSIFGGDAFKRRVLVLGAGARANRVLQLSLRPGAGFVVIGHVDMGECERVVADAIPRGEIESLTDYVKSNNVGEVVLSLQERRNKMPVDDLLKIRTTGVYVNEVSTFLERETGRVDLRSVNPSWLIFSDGFSSGRRVSTVAKRAFDVVVSLILLVITAPLTLLGMLAVRLDSKGPIFFSQTRVGHYGQTFEIVKLRSMRIDAEVAGKAVWASKNDPRVTRVGRVIRKVRIDELPQLWMVLKGEMSFVGPRPERPQFIAELAEKIPYYNERHVVKPGITGWAQINYPYGASLDDARHKLEYDLYYAKNYTPFLDLLILLQTVHVLLWPEGAR